MYIVKDNLIFDLDGTLINSFREIQECLFKAYLRGGIGINILNIKKNYIGPSIEKIILNVTPKIYPDKMNIVKKYFRDYYDNSHFQKTEVYPYVFDTLNQFKTAGKKIFIITNKPSKPAGIIIRKLFPDIFNDVISPDINKEKIITKAEMLNYLFQKWNLTKESSVLIGDSMVDIEVAKNHGVNSIGVLYGYGKKKDIIKLKPEFLIDNFKSLRDIIR